MGYSMNMGRRMGGMRQPAAQNLGLADPRLAQLMQRYVMASPSYQNIQMGGGTAQANPYVGKQYNYLGSGAAQPPEGFDFNAMMAQYRLANPGAFSPDTSRYVMGDATNGALL